MIESEYLKLLIEKNSILKDILNYTKNKEFKISEDEVDKIYTYIEDRDKLFNKLYNIENKIKDFIQNYNIENNDIKNIIDENNFIINEVIKFDKINKEIIDAISNLLKRKIKSVNELSKFNKSYLGTYENTVEGNLFDSSR
ncbi:hypothetical protein [uncultured Tyzzerella sp.]|uniref:hypothetical protein n=1 Tax=uncultured Tyzzerella sp. TaxID=2321398 RepID=UPI0029428655|nr:hypothetical protein [uncultured Tyzzerella sp.]